MLKLSAASRQAFLKKLDRVMVKKMEHVAFDYSQKVSSTLREAMMQSPQWSGNYARNWYAFTEGYTQQYREIAAKKELALDGNSDRLIYQSGARAGKDSPRVSRKGQNISEDLVEANSFYASEEFLLVMEKDQYGMTRFKFEPVIIRNDTPYGELIINDLSDEGESPFIRKVNKKPNGEVYNMGDLKDYIQMRWKFRWDQYEL